jgi:hypothetical protein
MNKALKNKQSQTQNKNKWKVKEMVIIYHHQAMEQPDKDKLQEALIRNVKHILKKESTD